MIRVVIAEDHALVRQGIRAVLEKVDDIEVIGEAADGLEAIELVQQIEPDVLVMDITMPRLNGIDATERIRHLGLETKVVIVSMHSAETMVRRALLHGAIGYLLKRSVAAELLVAIRAANEGKSYLSPGVSEFILADFLGDRTDFEQSAPIEQLTPRQREVLQLIAEGYTNRQMANTMALSVKTVEKHRASLMSTLGIHDIAGLTRFAIEHGLVFMDH